MTEPKDYIELLFEALLVEMIDDSKRFDYGYCHFNGIKVNVVKGETIEINDIKVEFEGESLIDTAKKKYIKEFLKESNSEENSSKNKESVERNPNIKFLTEALIDKMIEIASDQKKVITCVFEGIKIGVDQYTNEFLAKRYFSEAYHAKLYGDKNKSQEFQESIEKIHSKEQKALELVEKLLDENDMKVIYGLEESYQEYCASLISPKDVNILKFAKACAISMQKEISEGKEVTTKMMDSYEDKLNFCGLSGSAYSIAKNDILKKFWVHGDKLK